MADPLRLNLKVVPGASRQRVVGWLGDALKVTVTAPPESGKANAAVIALLAQWLDIAPERISIVKGHTQPRKTAELQGITRHDIDSRLPR